MRLIRQTRTALLASAALLPLPLASAQAVPRNLFTWAGTVDREVIIEVRGRDIQTRGSGMDASFAPRLEVAQALPRTDGIIVVRVENGRGDVEVLENPSARNNYTARLRVRDTRAGSDRYRIDVAFDAPGDRGNDGRYDGRGNDGRYDPRDNDGRVDPRDNGRNRDGDRNNDRGDVRGDSRDGNYGRDNDGRGDFDHNRRDAGVLRWSGIVDGVADIRIQGRRVDMISPRGVPVRNVRYDVLGAPLPRRDVRLELANGSGRGSIRVVQQPSPSNGYVAVIRIDDGRAGVGAYTFDLRW